MITMSLELVINATTTFDIVKYCPSRKVLFSQNSSGKYNVTL
jgi:hypothetical protein